MPAGNAVGNRISSTRMKTMFGRLPGCAAAAAACSKIPRLASIPPAATAPLRCRNSRRSMSLLVVDGMVRGRRHQVLEDAHQLQHAREAPHLAGAGHRAAEALVLVARHAQSEIHVTSAPGANIAARRGPHTGGIPRQLPSGPQL